MSKLVVLAAVVLVACKGKKDDVDTGDRIDHDEDGFYANEDCDDDDAAINPDADEICDSIDNDCDQAIDDLDDDLADGVFYYSDSDSDGFGDDASGVLSCDLVPDSVTLGGDCDDVDADINPSAQEICDDKDNDCDTLTDDDDSDTYGQLEYKVDADGDGWGDEKASPERFCVDPGSGYVSYDASTLQDCDDANPDYHPYAEELCTDTEDYNCDGSVGYDDVDKDGWPACEDCDDAQSESFPGNTEICDGFDNDCNTYVDDQDPELADGATYYNDHDADTYGDPTVSEVTCEPSPGFVDNGDDCDDDNDQIHPGATEICNRLDDDCDAALTPDESDDDGDSFVECEAASDCNDDDANIHPGADELCSTASVDDDCDGSADEASAVDAATWYYDFDNDNYGGSGGLTTVACTQPSDYVDNDDDCDDARASANPAATELCNGLDDNCDTTVPTDEVDGDGDTYMACQGDCDDSDASAFPGSLIFYRDVDGDGYGLASSTVTDCAAPSGYVDVSGDCLDSNDDVHPGATEHCNTLDDDCNGTVDDSYADDATLWHADADDDDFGDDATTTSSCTRPFGYTTDDTDCDDTDETVNPDAVELCNDGIDNDCDSAAGACELDATAVSEVVWSGESAGDQAGLVIASAGDVNADGVNELLIGAKGDDDAGSDAGAAYLAWGPVTSGTFSLSTIDAQKMTGQAGADSFGRSVAFIDDMDADGYDDVAVGAGNRSSSSKTSNGSVYFVSGVDMGHVSTGIGSLQSYSVIGAKSFDYLGTGLAHGDVDDDGSPDVWMGAAGVDDGATAAGAVYLLGGDLPSGSGTAGTSTTAKITGDATNDAIGGVLASGDFDGDGFSDLAIGDPLDTDSGTASGAVSIMLGPVTGTVSINLADAKIIASSAGDALGTSVANVNDTDGDGTVNLLCGAQNSDTNGVSAGSAYLVLGSGTIADLSGEAETVAEATFNGESTNDHAGGGVGGDGDFDGDGELDFLIGAGGYGSSGEGAVYLVLGPRSGSMTLDLDPGHAAARFVGDFIADDLGKQMTFTGQVTSVFNEGIFLANAYDNLGGADSGAAYIVFDIGL